MNAEVQQTGPPTGPEPAEPRNLHAKRDRLQRVLADCGSLCIGYSGGVDSALLVVAAVEALGAARVLAVTGVSASVSEAQLAAARRIARRHGVRHLEVRTDELADPAYAANPTDRCYHCKTELWSKLAPVARAHGLTVLADGTNADDPTDDRPGARAGAEHGVRSPLLEAGLSKQDVRALSRALGLETWDAPAAPCLASRLPHGLAVTAERLRQVEAAERAVAAHGFREFRVRHHGDVARLEFAAAELPDGLRLADPILAGVRAAGFERAGIDLGGYRSGALHRGGLVQLTVSTRVTDRSARARALLHARGVAFEDAAAAGFDVDVLWLRAAPAAARALDDDALRAAGFRWVALEPVRVPARRSA